MRRVHASGHPPSSWCSSVNGRMGRNPATGATVEIPAKQVVKARIAKAAQGTWSRRSVRRAAAAGRSTRQLDRDVLQDHGRSSERPWARRSLRQALAVVGHCRSPRCRCKLNTALMVVSPRSASGVKQRPVSSTLFSSTSP